MLHQLRARSSKVVFLASLVVVFVGLGALIIGLAGCGPDVSDEPKPIIITETFDSDYDFDFD